MKNKILIKMLADIDKPQIIAKGDAIDLRCAETTTIGDKVVYIPLGVAMRLPKGYQAIVVARSSTAKKQGIYNPGGIGIIDNTYNSNQDEWKFPASKVDTFAESVVIEKNERICQFYIQLSQKATLWQRIRHLFSNGIRLEFVDDLGDDARGGLGSTTEKDFQKGNKDCL